MPLVTRIQALLVVAVFAAVLGCNPTGHFVPGESPTVTPRYNAEGTPTAPIVITEDLPDGWRWQYSRELPVAGKDSWALLGAESEVIGFIIHDGGDCWVLVGQNVPDQSCHSRDEIGRFAAEILVVKTQNAPMPEASSATTVAQQETPLAAFKTAFEPENAGEEHQVRQLNDGTLTWTASVYGSGLYQLIRCPPGETAPPDGGCVTADIKMCKIAEMELTHPMAMASSADTLRRCFKQRANGGNDERDLRAERSGVFDPGDRPGVGHIAQHGAAVPEVAGGNAAQAAASAGFEAGSVHRVRRQADGRGVGKLRGAAPGVGGTRI